MAEEKAGVKADLMEDGADAVVEADVLEGSAEVDVEAVEGAADEQLKKHTEPRHQNA